MMWLTPNIAPHNNTSNQTHYTNSQRSPHSQFQTATASLYNANDIDAALDIDSEIKSQTSTSSSPQSTVSTFPLSTFDSLPPSRVSKAAPFPTTSATHDTYRLPSSNMMYAADTTTWASDDQHQFAPKPTAGRNFHNRESSLSSLGSFGPQSPFPFNSSNPQIAVNDSTEYHGIPNMQDDQLYQLAAKAPNVTSHDNFYANFPFSGSTSVQAYASMLAPQKHRGDASAGGLLPPPEFSSGGSSNSRPGSVASSDASDSPATPAAPEPEEERRRKTGENFFLTDIFNLNLDRDTDSPLVYRAGLAVPKLDRTMTDIFSDELFDPNSIMPSGSRSQPTQTSLSPTHDMFVQRVQAANNQHLTAATQPPVSSVPRGRSPFRNGSPLAPAPAQDFSQSANIRFHTAQQQREQRKAHEDAAQALRQTMAQSNASGTPQTISPKDALLEYNDNDSNSNFPLFPQQQQSTFDANQLAKANTQADFGGLSLDTSFNNYLTAQMPSASMQMPQQYPFVAKMRQQPSLPSASNGSFSMSSRAGSSASVSPSSAASASPQRPGRLGAEGGTYTCTYHGCTQRFETPALLQKHKREGHRQAHGLTGLRRPEGPTGNYFNTQAGPHKCERINPSTGKPCNTIFSRPYDLTRHEDTIHNARKMKVRCDVCTEEKTFSRADALTRHYRVCHPDLEFPGKHRKRGGGAN